MRRLRWVLPVLCLLLFLLLGTTVLYARTLPAPGPARFDRAGLDVCENRLCLFHITPGITTWLEAKSALTAYITHDDGDHFHGHIEDADIRVEMDDSGMQTGAIQVQGTTSLPNPLALTFRQILEHFGPPCAISAVDLTKDDIQLEYPTFTIQVQADQDWLTLESPVGSITLRNSSGATSAGDPVQCTGDQGGIPWQGFASLRKYDTLLMNGWQWSSDR